MLKKTLEDQNLKVADSYIVKPEKGGGPCCVESSKKQEYYPNFWLDSRTLPDVKDWDIDGDYTIVLKVTMKSKSMNTRGDKKEEVFEGSFDIKEAGVVENGIDEDEDGEEEKKDNAKKEMKKMYA